MASVGKEKRKRFTYIDWDTHFYEVLEALILPENESKAKEGWEVAQVFQDESR